MTKRVDNPVPGIVVIDKPQGLTSHDVVARVRRLAGTRKVGHAGTLDPMATGVLVIGVGKATKLLTWVTGRSKTYEATIRFGIATNTDDAEGDIVESRGCPRLDEAALERAISALRGPIDQVPSTVSAIKVDGKRAYALARVGEEVELRARSVTIHRFDVVSALRPGSAAVDDAGTSVDVVDADVVVSCSSGTYIRALARDLGAALGCGAHLTALRRTRVGDFGLEEALTLEQLSARALPAPESEARRISRIPLTPLADAARAMFPALELTADEAARFRHGQAPPRTAEELDGLDADDGGGDRGGHLIAVAPDGTVMGIVRSEGGRIRTVLVFQGDQ